MLLERVGPGGGVFKSEKHPEGSIGVEGVRTQKKDMRVAVTAVLILLGGIVATAAEGAKGGFPRTSERADLTFLEKHWRLPLAPQGSPPKGFSALEASLQSKNCGTCHPVQYQDWETSLHAKAMGPGVLGQAVELIEQDPSTALLCYSCHAPLAEQSSKLREIGGRIVTNPGFDPPLQGEGVTCAACHVRAHQRFGPPPRPRAAAPDHPREQLPHKGFIPTTAFERAEFCRVCHQFEPGDLALNGKLIENAFNEWREGPYAKEGRQCQQCHMPDRRHLWRGIHDAELVKQAVAVTLRVERRAARPGDDVEATLTVTNRGAGHMFPTYVTPQVFLRAELVDAAGKAVPGTLVERIIGRGVSLDLTRELYDTRIPPHGTFTFRFSRKAERAGLRLRAWVTVHPDYHYAAIFKSLIASAGDEGRPLLEQALHNAEASQFEIFHAEEPVS